MKLAVLLIAVILLATPAFGKVFNRCSLAKEMYRLGTPKSELPIWTCIAQYYSAYDTAAVGSPGSDGSQDYGLFQINNLYWCQPTSGTFSYNECSVSCSELITDDISKTVACSRKIKNQQGWTAWGAYNSNCAGTLSSIDNCF